MKRIEIAGTDRGLLHVLYEDERPVQLVCEPEEAAFRLGDIYLGRVESAAPALHSAFLSLSGGSNAFLPLKNHEKVRTGEEIPVQIMQESLGSKLPTVSRQLSLPGRFVVLNTDAGMLRFSHRLDWQEEKKEDLREELRDILSRYGLILRTLAENESAEKIVQEAADLAGEMEKLRQRAASSPAHTRLRQGASVAEEWMDGIAGEELESVLTDSKDCYERLLAYSQIRNDIDTDRLALWEGEKSLYQAHGLERLCRETSERIVWLKSGAYLVIDKTEALTAVDVNSGRAELSGLPPFEINGEAAAELLRQLRLRNVSGMILVDFISMPKKSDQELLLVRLKELAQADPVQTRVHDLTELGLVEMTRRRMRRPFSWQRGKTSEERQST